MLCRSAKWTDRPVNKSKTIVQGRTLGSNSVTVQLQQGLRENLVIPVSDSVAVCIYVVKHLAANHA